MLIPFGVFSAAGAGGGAAAGSYELISTAYGTGSSNTVVFSSIPSDYKHLQIRWVARNTTDAVNGQIRFNGDATSGNYKSHFLYGNGSSVTSSYGDSDKMDISYTIANSGSASGVHGVGVLDLLDYASTSKSKTSRLLGGLHGSLTRVYLRSNWFAPTSAISSITFYAGTTGTTYFTSTSRFSLYGIKG